jgi:EpsD family peptidyl-prolyl cis-trans isomerase
MRRYWIAAVVAALALAPGCSKKAGETASQGLPEEKLAATVEDWSLSREQLDEFLRRLPESQRIKYSTPDGMSELTQKLMHEEVAYREAKKMKLAEQAAVAAQIEEATRSILVTHYLREVVDPKARPSDEELHEYYEAHQDLYTTLETIRAQHVFSKDKAKLEDIKRRVEEGGEKFTTMAHLYSEDKLTQPDGGDLGYFNPGGYIKGVGYSQMFTDAVATMEPGKLYGPIKWEQGYSLVRISEKRPAELRPYDEVVEDIAGRLSREKVDAVRGEHFAEVEKHYQTRNFVRETYEKTQRGPEELFNFAQASSEPHQRIAAFEEIVAKFPEDKYAPQALFMVGFVYAEELKDIVMADRTFAQLIDKYPDSEMAPTAKWMRENLNEPLPKFEDLDDLNRQIDEKTN